MLHTAHHLNALRIQNAVDQIRSRGLAPILQGSCYPVTRCRQCGKPSVLGALSAGCFASNRVEDATFTICFHCWQTEEHAALELTLEDAGCGETPFGDEEDDGYEDEAYGYGSGEPYEDEQQRLIDQYGEGGFETGDGHFFPESWHPS
jgi:hypothetical protein